MADESFDYPTMARALILGDKDTVARKTREGLDLSIEPKVLRRLRTCLRENTRSPAYSARGS